MRPPTPEEKELIKQIQEINRQIDEIDQEGPAAPLDERITLAAKRLVLQEESNCLRQKLIILRDKLQRQPPETFPAGYQARGPFKKKEWWEF